MAQNTGFVGLDIGKYAGQRSIKGGRNGLRRLLYQAALSAARFNPTLKAFATRMRYKSKPYKVILIAVARNHTVIANILLAKNIIRRDVT